MGVIMPAILDLLYREYCRARLAEMGKRISIAAARPEPLEADHQPAKQGDDEPTDARRATGHDMPN